MTAFTLLGMGADTINGEGADIIMGRGLTMGRGADTINGEGADTIMCFYEVGQGAAKKRKEVDADAVL